MSISQQITRVSVLSHLVIWLTVAVLYVGVLGQMMDWEMALKRSFFNLISLAALFYVNTFLFRFYWPRRQYFKYVCIALLCLFFFTLIRAKINTLFPEMVSDNFNFQSNLKTWLIGGFVSNFSVIILSVLYSIFQINIEQEKRRLEERNIWNETQLQYLRSQINPHFLFNTLNNIYSLAVTQSKQTAPMVMQLSQLLRFVLYEAQEGRISLEEEIKQIRHYIQLFQLRSEEPLDVPFLVTGLTSNFKIEPMLLIPIVENCFKHSDIERNPLGYIQLELNITDQKLYFKAENTYDPTDTQKDGVGGIGVENIRKRLKISYSENARLKIEKKEQLFKVELEINRAVL